MTFPLLGKSYFFACAAIAAQSREARCKNSRSAERGCSSVHPPPNRRRMGGDSNPAPPPTGYRRAIAQSAVQKQPERRALRPQARFGAQPPQAALGAEIGCSSVHPPPNRRRMGGGSNPAPPPTGYRRAIAQSAVQKTAGAQSAAPAGAFRSATAAGGTWRGDRMFLCSPAAEQAANGWRRQPDLTAGEAANPAPPPTSYRHAAQSWHLT